LALEFLTVRYVRRKGSKREGGNRQKCGEILEGIQSSQVTKMVMQIEVKVVFFHRAFGMSAAFPRRTLRFIHNAKTGRRKSTMVRREMI
jgi:hypothetical protein